MTKDGRVLILCLSIIGAYILAYGLLFLVNWKVAAGIFLLSQTRTIYDDLVRQLIALNTKEKE